MTFIMLYKPLPTKTTLYFSCEYFDKWIGIRAYGEPRIFGYTWASLVVIVTPNNQVLLFLDCLARLLRILGGFESLLNKCPTQRT